MSYTSSNRRLISNTLFLYARTLVLLVIGVFTSRVTLQALGVDNYGVINIVSGFVSMFTIISGSLTGACQRFITYELGTERRDVRTVFSASVHIHLLLCVVILLLAESIGLYFVNHKLNLPPDTHYAVQWVYQCAVISFLISLMNIPFNALIIAYERLKIFAYISLIEAGLKLSVVLSVLYIPGNKLILYSALGLVSYIIVRIIFQVYCHKAFADDIKVKRKPDIAISKKIFGFAGWAFIGNSATILSNQGVNVVLNIFCGVAVNAARGIAVMVEGIITNFVTNFTTALNPQITKAYASGDRGQLGNLVEIGMRISFFLMLVIAVPIFISAQELMHIWFVEVPEYTTIFVRITLCVAYIQAIGNPFLTLLLATGKIMKYQITVGGITLLNLPLSYIALKQGASPESVYFIALVISSSSFVIRLLFVRHYANFPIRKITGILLGRLSITSLAAIGVTYLVKPLFGDIDSFLDLIFFAIISVILILTVIYIIGLTSDDRKVVTQQIRSKIL